MPALKQIHFRNFGIGKDLTKSEDIAEANRLRELKNAFVNSGKSIEKRFGSNKTVTLESGSVGLVPGNGKLNTFYEDSFGGHAHALFQAHQLDHGSIVTPVYKIHYGDVFDNFLYIAAEYQNGDKLHHYLDSTIPTAIQDVNCPHTENVKKIGDRVFASGTPLSGVTRFSKVANLRDWTGTDDAGFLPTGRHQEGGGEPKGLGEFKDSLVPLHRTGSQIWTLDANPLNMARQQSLPAAQTRYPRAITPMNDDLFFLSDSGFRTISEVLLSEKSLKDVDVGDPIDDEVINDLPDDEFKPVGIFYKNQKQFICFIDSKAYAFSVNREKKVSAWSKYIYPWPVEYLADLDNQIYMRSGDSVYKIDKDLYQDDGATIQSEIIMPLVDAKKPDIKKQFMGYKISVEGTVEVSFRIMTLKGNLVETSSQTITGPTAHQGLLPMGFTATACGPVIRHNLNEPFKLNSISLFYKVVGT